MIFSQQEQDYYLARQRIVAQLRWAEGCLADLTSGQPPEAEYSQVWNDASAALAGEVARYRQQLLTLDDLFCANHGASADWASWALVQRNID